MPSHPQHALVSDLFRSFGYLPSFELQPELECFDYLNRVKLGISATHLGDNRTLAMPVTHTIFYEMCGEARARIGISDSLIRVSIGIEDTVDLVVDFKQAL